ncbi:transposase [Novosphingobium sp. SG707]|uniref:transposase n=1 Tax=Novosphingobium sp. SG707 TaxID=2586996 RepID=UPI00144753D6|nr:hypothetical protein [Novosphingobium sp. SG707]
MPKRIVLDIDGTSTLSMAVSNCACSTLITMNIGFQPIVVFDGEGRFIIALLRPAKRPDARKSGISCAACCAR